LKVKSSPCSVPGQLIVPSPSFDQSKVVKTTEPIWTRSNHADGADEWIIISI
jgi:hypothetical protein